ncbi:unnamed protein product [Ectocarpus fasciculatus]
MPVPMLRQRAGLQVVPDDPPAPSTRDRRPVVAIDLGKFGTAYSWKADEHPIPRGVRNLDMEQPREGVMRKSPNSLLVHRERNQVLFGDLAEARFAGGSSPVGSQLFRRFGRQLWLESSWSLDTRVKCSRNRSMVELMEILVYMLNHIRDAALLNLSTAGTPPVTVDGVTWVLTVPASLPEQQRETMRTAAVMSSLVDDGHDDEHLVFCPEAIAACLAFQYNPGQDSLTWNVGDTYLVVDCGGVTVDLHAVGVCDTEKRELSIMHEGTSGPWGAENADKQFESLLQRFVKCAALGASNRVVTTFLNSSAKLRIMQAWETSKVGWKDKNDECWIDLTDLEHYPLEVTIEDMDRARNNENRHGEELVGGHGTYLLVLKPAWMKKAFQESIDMISKALSEQLGKRELQRLTSVVMVGGFSENVLVQEAIRTCVLDKHPLGNVHVLIHTLPSLAIAQGAAHFTSQGKPGSAMREPTPEPATMNMWPDPIGVVDFSLDDTLSGRLDRMTMGIKSQATLETARRSPGAEMKTPGGSTTDQGRGRQVRTNTLPVIEAVVHAAKELAESSKVPGISEVAKLVVLLLSHVEEHRNNVAEARETAEWCSGILHVLTEADRVLRESTVAGCTTLVQKVEDAISELLQLINTYKSKNTFVQVVTSKLFKRRKEQLEAVVKQALSDLNFTMEVHIGTNVNEIGTNVKEIGTNVNAMTDKLNRLGGHMAAMKRHMSTILQDGRTRGAQPGLFEEPQASGAESLAEARRRRRQQIWGDIEIPEKEVHIMDFLGQGGFGEVYMGDYGGKNVAIKVQIYVDHGLNGHCVGRNTSKVGRVSAQMAERASSKQKEFMREVDMMYHLKSPHTVLLHGVITSHRDRLELVMELLEGDLNAYLRNAKEPLPEEVSRRIIGDVCAGMAFLHENETIHCDLKSANVLLDKNDRAKIGDFGTSRTTKNTNYTRLITHTAGHGTNKMTSQWTAPEVLYGEKHSYASDVYSFGVVLWEVMSRKTPWSELANNEAIFNHVKILEQRPAIPTGTPPDIEEDMKSCWAQQPRNRPDFAFLSRRYPFCNDRTTAASGLSLKPTEEAG